ERRWREAFEHHPAMYFIVDSTGTVLSANAHGASQLGYTVDDLVGRPALNVVFEDDREFVRNGMAACFKTPGQSNSWEGRKVRNDGRVVWVRENAKAIRWSPNQLIILSTSEDITERYSSELESSRLAAIVSSSDDAIISKTLDGKITSWNAGASNIFGYESAEMVGESIIRIIPPELHEQEEQILMRLRQGERIRHFETVRTAKDGRRIDVSLSVSPLFSKSGGIVGASKVARVITESKSAERALREGA